MAEPPPLALTLPISKNRIGDPRNNKTLARSNAIIVRRWVTMPVSILIVSQKTSFDLDKLFVNDYG